MLENKVAVVTGGSRGLGRGMVEAFLKEGASVAFCGRSQEKGDQALKELNAGDKAIFVSADARSQQDMEGLVDTAIRTFGKVDILVANAGGSSGFAEVANLSDEAWQEANDWILNSAFWTTRRSLPSMEKSGWGRIIYMSSVEGKAIKKPLASHYATFKHALHGLAKAVAVEYSPRGITCNAICPGAVETDLMQIVGRQNAETMGVSYEDFLDGYAQETLTKKLNTVEEVVAVVMLLVSNAGGGITGTTINVDGGSSPF